MAVAEKVTDDPGQKGLDEETMEIPAGRFGLTIIRSWMLDVGLPDVQGSDEVSRQDTRSPFAG